MELSGSANGLIASICQRAADGESLPKLRAELLATLLPSFQKRAQRAARAIGPFVDGAEIESRVLERIWKLIESSDLENSTELERLLSVCESRARKDASRSADTLARRIRKAHRTYIQLVEFEAQKNTHDLSYEQRRNIARSVCPVEPSDTVLDQIMNGAPSILAIDELYDSAMPTSSHWESSETPEAALIRAEEREAVQQWLENLPRKADRYVLARRYSGEHPMSAPLSSHLKDRARRSGGQSIAELILSA